MKTSKKYTRRTRTTRMKVQKVKQVAVNKFAEATKAATLFTGIAAGVAMTVMALIQGLPGGDFLY